jgi:hypothetical protein
MIDTAFRLCKPVQSWSFFLYMRRRIQPAPGGVTSLIEKVSSLIEKVTSLNEKETQGFAGDP